jgi:hypothetical protein
VITPLFRQGDPVRKVGGTYEADGFVVGVAVTSRGDVRYVFEFVEPAGMLHIFNEGQLRAREADPLDAVPVADDATHWRNRYMETAGKLDAAVEGLQLANVAFGAALDRLGGKMTATRADLQRIEGYVVVGGASANSYTFELKAAESVPAGLRTH